MIEEVFGHPLRVGPFAILAATVAWLGAATWHVSRQTGGSVYGFGASARQRWAQRLFRAAVVGALLASLAHAIHLPFALVAPLPGLPMIVRAGGLLLAAFGAIATVVARSDMGRNWRVGVPRSDPSALVTDGLFARSRNPVFVGMLILTAGLTAAVPSPAMIVCALAFSAACRMQVRDEETFLESAFGEDYRRYKRRVRRWI